MIFVEIFEFMEVVCLLDKKKIFAYEFSQFKKYTFSTLKKPHTECSEFFILWKFKICDWILSMLKNTIALSIIFVGNIIRQSFAIRIFFKKQYLLVRGSYLFEKKINDNPYK